MTATVERDDMFLTVQLDDGQGATIRNESQTDEEAVAQVSKLRAQYPGRRNFKWERTTDPRGGRSRAFNLKAVVGGVVVWRSGSECLVEAGGMWMRAKPMGKGGDLNDLAWLLSRRVRRDGMDEEDE